MTQELLSEIQQKRPFKSLEQEAFLNIVRTASVLQDSFDKVLKPAGITSAQYNVLRILRGAEPEGLCRNEVRDRMLTRMPDMTRLLDRMETAGLVSRTRDSEDRRVVTTRVSNKGARLLEKLDGAVAREHERRLSHLTKTQLETLIALLSAVRRGG
ncbi:MAG TPA: MarR family transcriptional regulator [Longimicrobiales bacterium]|nr:MarR family transcriptional regulator [Longimicrobiales bacterium]